MVECGPNGLLLLTALLAPYLAPYDPFETHLSERLLAPSLRGIIFWGRIFWGEIC
ncbi:MAG: hypothetical protein R2865_13720 [Deinococcales bacterium]